MSGFEAEMSIVYHESLQSSEAIRELVRGIKKKGGDEEDDVSHVSSEAYSTEASESDVISNDSGDEETMDVNGVKGNSAPSPSSISPTRRRTNKSIVELNFHRRQAQFDHAWSFRKLLIGDLVSNDLLSDEKQSRIRGISAQAQSSAVVRECLMNVDILWSHTLMRFESVSSEDLTSFSKETSRFDLLSNSVFLRDALDQSKQVRE